MKIYGKNLEDQVALFEGINDFLEYAIKHL